MILIGILLICISLLFEYLSNKNLVQGVCVSEAYNNTVRTLRVIGKVFCTLGVVFWIIIIVLSIIIS